MELRKSRLDKPVIGEPSYDGSLLNIDKETGRGVFIFPDGKTRLEGAWDTDTGMMIRAKEDGQNEVQMFLEKQFPGPNALVPCPYESQYVFVAKSSAMNGGEGLFAKKHLPANFLASYYAGQEISLDTVYGRPWDENVNTILVDDSSFALDIPKPLHTLDKYCASLGHKANHSKKNQNCTYAAAFHPRFGHIMSVKTIKFVPKGSELFVDYMFNEHWAAPWFADN